MPTQFPLKLTHTHTHTHTHTVTVDGKFTTYKGTHPPSEDYLRAMGPKTVHAERTLYFYAPEQYKAVKAARRALEKQLSEEFGLSPTRSLQNKKRHGNLSSITIHAVDFETKRFVQTRLLVVTTSNVKSPNCIYIDLRFRHSCSNAWLIVYMKWDHNFYNSQILLLVFEVTHPSIFVL